MALSIPGRLVLLDYGTVISLPQSAAARDAVLAAAGDVDPDRFWAAYDDLRHDLDRGRMPIAEFWRGVGRACDAEFDDGRVAELWTADLRSWITAEPDVVRLIAELRAGGTRLALLSNAAADYGSVFRFAPWADGFEGVFVSGELGLLKPEAAIYEHVARATGTALADIVFVDDRAENVAGAAALGITAHLFTGAAALRSALESLAADRDQAASPRSGAERGAAPEAGRRA